MKLVIDIPENVIEGAKSSPNYYPTYHFERIWRAIANGIPLPKGHGDLIDRDKFKSLMDEYFIDTSRLHYDDLTNAEHLNWGIENCLNEIDEMDPVIKADNEVQND